VINLPPSTVANIVDLVRPTTFQFIARNVHQLRPAESTKRCRDRRAVLGEIFSKSRVSGVTMGWLLRLVTGGPTGGSPPDSSTVLSD